MSADSKSRSESSKKSRLFRQLSLTFADLAKAFDDTATGSVAPPLVSIPEADREFGEVASHRAAKRLRDLGYQLRAARK